MEVIFDGSIISATTNEASANISLKGYSVSPTDVGRVIAVRGGRNFKVGPYLIMSIDASLNTWKLDRPCTIGAGGGMTGKIVSQEGRWHEPVLEYYQADLTNNAGQAETRQCVLNALNVLEPAILKSLAETCFKRELLVPEVAGNHAWYGPLQYLHWVHVRDAGRVVPLMGAIFGNLLPLKAALLRWAKDEGNQRWNFCDNEGEPLEWVMDAGVQTLVLWQLRDRLPKKLDWENFDLYRYRSLDSEDAFRMLELEQDFDAGSGFVRIAPEYCVEASRLSARSQRDAKKEYKLFGQKLGLRKMERLSSRYIEWYALRSFLRFSLRKIREREDAAGNALGDPENPDDVSAISHGVSKIADLVGFHR